jgi:hypothetical protein
MSANLHVKLTLIFYWYKANCMGTVAVVPTQFDKIYLTKK